MSAGDLVRAELEALGAGRLAPFDAHAHTGVDVDGSARTSAEHVAALEAIGGRSVIFPFCVAGGYEPENRRVVAEAGRDPERLVPYARLDPRVSAAADAVAALEGGARGFKLHPRGESFRLEHPGVEAIFGVAAGARVPVLIHAGGGVGSFGPILTELAARHRRCPIVLAHAGVSDLAWLWRVVPEHPNLYFDTSWMNTVDLLALFSQVPPGRILYGSDAPYMDVEAQLAITLRCAHFAELPEDTIGLIAGGQMEALLAGERPHDAGPAPGLPRRPISVEANRLASSLVAFGGAVLSGGDVSRIYDLVPLAYSGTAPLDAEIDPRVPELIEIAHSPSPERVSALSLALTLTLTPGVASGVVAA